MKNQNQTLILLTNHFPFGTAESFIENEIPFLEKSFDRVFIIAKDVHSNEIRPTGKNVTVIRINPKSSLTELAGCIFLFLRSLKKIITFSVQEINFIRKNRLAFAAAGRVMIHDLAKALIYGHHIDRVIRSNRISDVTLYSYWLTSSAMATLFVNSSSKIRSRISRAHGGDVYEIRNSLRYLSFRTALANKLSGIFTISEDARRHLLSIVGKDHADKIKVSRLGTPLPKQLPDANFQEPFVLVSCSFMVPVKRIHLIIEALALINDIQIQWIHFGDGPLKSTLKENAHEMLSLKKNISYDLRPSLPNRELIRFYQENTVHLFVNVSSSEGIPVSIMEAQSFGIPSIGPDTGGVPEIISEDNGILISQEGNPTEIASAIRHMLSLKPAAYFEMRENSQRNWELKFSADQNFPSFVSQIRQGEETKS